MNLESLKQNLALGAVTILKTRGASDSELNEFCIFLSDTFDLLPANMDGYTRATNDCIELFTQAIIARYTVPVLMN